MDHSEVKHLPKVDHTPDDLDEASKLLLKAADLLEIPGVWGQGSFSEKRVIGSHCAMTAIRSLSKHYEAEQRFARAFGGVLNVYEWNDTEGRTKEEVIAKLRAVALGL